MGVDTKLICLTKKKDPFLFTKIIENVLSKMIFDEADRKGRLSFDDYNKYGSSEISNFAKMIRFNFLYKNEQRSVFCFFDADSDTNNPFLVGKKFIMLSIGYWGHSNEIMIKLSQALKEEGPVYLDVNDSDSESYKEI